MNYSFIEFYLGNKRLGSGYVKMWSTEKDRRSVARKMGILYYDGVKIGGVCGPVWKMVDGKKVRYSDFDIPGILPIDDCK